MASSLRQGFINFFMKRNNLHGAQQKPGSEKNSGENIKHENIHPSSDSVNEMKAIEGLTEDFDRSEDDLRNEELNSLNDQ